MSSVFVVGCDLSGAHIKYYVTHPNWNRLAFIREMCASISRRNEREKRKKKQEDCMEWWVSEWWMRKRDDYMVSVSGCDRPKRERQARVIESFGWHIHQAINDVIWTSPLKMPTINLILVGRDDISSLWQNSLLVFSPSRSLGFVHIFFLSSSSIRFRTRVCVS